MAVFETSSFVAVATFLGAVIALVTTAFMWNRRQAPGAASVAWLMIAAAIWSGGYGIEVLLEDIDDKLLLVPIEYVGISTVPVFWFLTAAHLTGRIRNVTPRLLVILLVIPMITVALAATNSSHNLMWTNAYVVGDSGSISEVHGESVDAEVAIISAWIGGAATISSSAALSAGRSTSSRTASSRVRP